ncbi:Programmed cell death 6-interacting protein [Thelohanellus kitauei]|uniref:Programmed cell death 6-interacting protein n=1 Tax=Thelohanellus kitauei TaxID=669202 RepID=A0A0C2M9U2_THEKT|nr:Programmed cell death 6-interacting protein [Thelohanellus kitauei]
MDAKITWCFKKSDPVDLESFCCDFVKARYGDALLDSLRGPIKALHCLRNTVVSRTNEKEPPELDKLAEYYVCLKVMEPLINSHEGDDFVRTTWYDTHKRSLFSSSKKGDPRISFEIANILHLLGMRLWWDAEELTDNDSESVKKRISLWQLAASAFQELHNISRANNLGDLMQDISSEMADILTKLCLIRAQAGFISKCSGESDDAYLLRMTYFNYVTSKNINEIIKKSTKITDKNLEQFCHITELYSAIEYMSIQSKIDSVDKKYGDYVSRRKVCFNIAIELNKLVNSPKSRKLLNEYREKWDTAERENELIYHLPLTTSFSEPSFKPLQAARPQELNVQTLQVKSTLIVDAFKTLVPGVVRNATRLFNTRLSNIRTELCEERETSDSLIFTIFAEMNIPAYFEKFNEKNLPPSFTEKIKVLTSDQGINYIIENLRSLDNTRLRCENTLNQAIQLLNREASEDNSFKSQYGVQWRRISSVEANHMWRETIDKYKNYLSTAQKSDMSLDSKFQKIKPSLDSMMKNAETLSQLIYAKNNKMSKLGQSDLSNIRDAYNQIIRIQRDRNNKIEELKINDRTVDQYFLGCMTSDGSLNVEAACQKYIESLQPKIETIRKSFDELSIYVDRLMVQIYIY